MFLSIVPSVQSILFYTMKKVDHGMISQADADSVAVVDTADEAMEILRCRIPELENQEAESPTIRDRRAARSRSPASFRAD